MKIIIAGATGTIGKRVVNAVQENNEIISAGLESGDIQVDISRPR